MDFFQLLSELDKADPEFMDRLNPRRRVFQYLGSTGKKLTAAAAPAILASFFNRAYGQTTTLPQAVVDVLNLALGLEYLEYYFYDTALGISGLVPAAETAAIQVIRNDEAGHINTLRAALGASAIADPTRAAFDYSGGSGSMAGPMAAALVPGGVNANGAIFFGAAQAFSDTGQRAYKGGAPVLNTAATKDILEAALNIHSVEARHNSHFRTVRRAIAANALGSATAVAVSPFDAAPKSWISGIDNNGPTAPNGSKPAAAVYGVGADPTAYPIESNTTQAGVNLLTGIGTTVYTAAQASEAFDEPLDPATVKIIARMFVTPAAITNGLFR
ncbi:ferritin-like domain-containing protein [Hymenobacter bucti]|uniref:Ferritin-like domain-containing protein n=1 Tax=Hymenobacter bucti TaxID=1844114 RepID=A0ABW4QWJ5_9BACT